MNRNHNLFLVSFAVLAMALAGCKSMGMAGTSKGQLFKINIYAPTELPEYGEDNVDVVLSNRGVNNIQDILADVELPRQLTVVSQTADRGIDVVHDPGSNTYHFSLGKLQPAEDAHIRFRVRVNYGSALSAPISVTAWQKDLPGDKLFRKTVIKPSSTSSF